MQDVSRCLGREPPNSISGGKRTRNCWRSRLTTDGPEFEFNRSQPEEVKNNLCDRQRVLGGPDGCGGQDEDGDLRPILRGSYENEGDWQAVRYTNILGAPRPNLLNEDGKLIDSGQIIIAQKLLERKNDIYVMMVSWRHCVTPKDRYITVVSTVTVTAVTHLGFEYRSVHDGEHSVSGRMSS